MIRRLKQILSSRGDVIGINGRNLELIYPHNARRFFPNVDDKLRCKQLLSKKGIPTPKTFHVIDSRETLSQWPSKLAGFEHFVIKPSSGCGGSGILLATSVDDHFVISGEPWSEQDISFHLLQVCNGAFSLDNRSDQAVFEQRVTNHPSLAALLPAGVEGVCDIRLIFKEETPVMGMLRMPTVSSKGKANLHQGGIGVGIDFQSGRTVDGCLGNQIITRHPESNVKLRGHKLIDLDRMLSMGAKISEAVGLGYIGVDFVLDAYEGPLVLEVNARPGLNIQIANQAGLRGKLA